MQKVIEEVKQDRAGFIHTTTESSNSDSYEAPTGLNQRNSNQTGYNSRATSSMNVTGDLKAKSLVSRSV